MISPYVLNGWFKGKILIFDSFGSFSVFRRKKINMNISLSIGIVVYVYLCLNLILTFDIGFRR